MKGYSSMTRIVASGLLALILAGCAVGPDYRRPTADIPVRFKHDAPWKEATPADHLAKGNWWEIYADPVLNDLEEQAATANLSLQAAYASLAQVQATAGISKSERMPRLDLNAGVGRQRTAADLSPAGSGQVDNLYSLPLALSYEVDLWGRVRRSVEAAQADVDGATADYHALLLSLQAELASSYFRMRTLDGEIALLNQTVGLRQEALQLVQSRYEHGQIGQLDLSRAEAELASTRAEAIGLQKQRGELENRIALLIGQNPSTFSLPSSPLDLDLPALAVGLSSSLLERRPDVAAAERQMAAASARIGVAKSAFFPAISLTGSAGFASNQGDSLFDWDNRTWGLGPAISLPIFDAGRNSANLDRARSAYEQAVASYRQQVLVAFQEVEDGLHGLKVLADQGAMLLQAVAAAEQAWQISESRYRNGLVNYLEVVDSQRTALQIQRSMTRLQGEQFATTVLLIKALGGGWQG